MPPFVDFDMKELKIYVPKGAYVNSPEHDEKNQ